VTELAERVQLSVSPCHRRLRTLERSGAISGYRAHLDAHAFALKFEAFVFVTMLGADCATLDAFEEAVAAIPNVPQAQRLFGDRLPPARYRRGPSRLREAVRRPLRHPPRGPAPQLHSS